MSRIGRQPIPLPPGVKVTLEGRRVCAAGPKGTLSLALADGIDVRIADGGAVVVSRAGESAALRALHGTTRALVANMVTGVGTGFTKTLQLWGVGYNAETKGRTVSLNVGFCHRVDLPIPEGLEVKTERISVEGVNVWQISLSGADKVAVNTARR